MAQAAAENSSERDIAFPLLPSKCTTSAIRTKRTLETAPTICPLQKYFWKFSYIDRKYAWTSPSNNISFYQRSTTILIHYIIFVDNRNSYVQLQATLYFKYFDLGLKNIPILLFAEVWNESYKICKSTWTSMYFCIFHTYHTRIEDRCNI